MGKKKKPAENRESELEFVVPEGLRFTCTQCGKCCRHLRIPLTRDDVKRIEKTDWTQHDETFARRPPIRRIPGLGGEELLRLEKAKRGGCCFLTDDLRCLIHVKKGPAPKPLACRIFPFKFTRVGNRVHVGIKFNCPGVLAGDGALVADHLGELRKLYRTYEREFDLPEPTGTVPFHNDVSVAWSDLEGIEEVLRAVLTFENLPILKRLILGTRVLQGLKDQAVGLEEGTKEVDVDPERMYRDIAEEDLVPGRLNMGERLFFTQFLGTLAAQDLAGVRRRGLSAPLLRLRVGWLKTRIARGGGWFRFEDTGARVRTRDVRHVPRLEPDGEELELLERYYRTKLESRDYFGSSFYDLPFVAGFNMLVATYPLVHWMARASAASESRKVAGLGDYRRALYAVELCLYSSDVMVGSRGRIAGLMLGSPGFVERLAVHYTIGGAPR